MEKEKCRLNIWHRAQKMYLQEISFWGNLGLSGKMVGGSWSVCRAVTDPVLDLVQHLEPEES